MVFSASQRTESFPDYYLVLTGLYASPGSSCGVFRPWAVEGVYLFHGRTLLDALRLRGARLNAATSIPKALWTAVELYPVQHNPQVALTDAQRAMLALFR